VKSTVAKPLKNPAGLLFDLDGTLLDSFSVHFNAYAVMFSHYGIRVTEETFLATYSPDWYQTYAKMGLPREVWEQANDLWLAEANKCIPALFPGVKETLAQLSVTYPLGIVTSGSQERVWRDLESNAIRSFFQTIVTGDDISQPKPAPEGLERALEKLGIPADAAFFVGDTITDFETARSANVSFIGVLSRFGGLDSHTGCPLVASISELPGLFPNNK
jgi:HAD superfamily hydrolase (TIGR01549 family)